MSHLTLTTSHHTSHVCAVWGHLLYICRCHCLQELLSCLLRFLYSPSTFSITCLLLCMFTDSKHNVYPQQQKDVEYSPYTALHCIYNLLLIATLDSVNYCHQPHLVMAVHRPGLLVWSTHQANCCYHGYQHIIHTLVLAVGGVHTWKVSAWLACCTIVIGNSTSQRLQDNGEVT